MNVSIFEFNSYVEFIIKIIEKSPYRGRGVKSSLAKFIKCQSTYISQVLNERAHFNMEQAEGCARFFNLPPAEKKYFMVLVQYQKAGNTDLKSFFADELEQLKKSSLLLKNRLDISNELSDHNKERYYSSWVYSAVHILCSLTSVSTLNDIANNLSITLKEAEEISGFLLGTGLITNDETGFKVGTTRIHLDNNSYLINHHHRNWRIKTLLRLDSRSMEDLHYSSVVSVSEDDVFKIKSKLIDYLKETKEIIKESSPEEKCYVFNIDFFDIC